MGRRRGRGGRRGRPTPARGRPVPARARLLVGRVRRSPQVLVDGGQHASRRVERAVALAVRRRQLPRRERDARLGRVARVPRLRLREVDRVPDAPAPVRRALAAGAARHARLPGRHVPEEAALQHRVLQSSAGADRADAVDAMSTDEVRLPVRRSPAGRPGRRGRRSDPASGRSHRGPDAG